MKWINNEVKIFLNAREKGILRFQKPYLRSHNLLDKSHFELRDSLAKRYRAVL
jgi:hypothetical protein